MAELILIRHAQAEEKRTTDEARKLTGKGRKQAERLAKYLASDIDECDLFIHSDIVRAKETLKLVIGKKENLNIMTTDSLMHEAKPAELGTWLKVHADDLQKVIAVGHEPHLSRFVAWAIARSNQIKFKIKKGCVIRLEILDFSTVMSQRMQLNEFISPKKIKNPKYFELTQDNR